MSGSAEGTWMKELTGGNNSFSPIISDQLLAEVSALPVSEAIECVLSGGYLKKWRRSQPLTTKWYFLKGWGTKQETLQLSSQALGHVHDRYFWVSRVGGTFFLRWNSRRKRNAESVYSLCAIESIRRADEVDSYDYKNSRGTEGRKNVFIISGAVSLQLAAPTPRDALQWIAGIYHIATAARNEFALSWIKNSSRIKLFMDVQKYDGKTSSTQSSGSEELDKGSNELSISIFSQDNDVGELISSPMTLTEVVDLMAACDITYYPERVPSIVAAAVAVVKARETWIHRLLTRILDSQFWQVDNLVRFMGECAKRLNELKAPWTKSGNQLFILDKLMTPEEVAELLHDVVKQTPIRVNLGGRSGEKSGSLEVKTIQPQEGDPNQEEKEQGTQEAIGTQDAYEGAETEDGTIGSVEESEPERATEDKVQEVLKPIENKQYEKFLEKVQQANREEITGSILEVLCNKNSTVFTTLKKRGGKESKLPSSAKAPKASIPIRMLTVMGFHWALAQKFNNVVVPQDVTEIANLLKYPLPSFWVASSHNTYLTGNQVGGTATASALAEALLRGCRCIELDCQDGPSGEPVLFHSWKAYQLTGSVTLREALVACKEAAFRVSKLPVILSIQMACSEECSRRTAQLCREILADELYIPDPTKPLDHVASVPIGSLLCKFIIKGKVQHFEGRSLTEAEKEWLQVVALHGYRMVGRTPEQIAHAKKIDMYSMNETHFTKVAGHKEFIQGFTDAAMIRVFPSGTRVASTNFCPLDCWASGVQFAAMNYQSCDRSMLINYGKFNQSFGYVLKPPELRPLSFTSSECMDYFRSGPVLLRIHVLSASQLPPPNDGLEHQNFASALDNILYSIEQGGVALDLVKLGDQIDEILDEAEREYIDEDEESSEGAQQPSVSMKDLSPRLPDTTEQKEVELTVEKSSDILTSHVDSTCPFVEVMVLGEGECVQRTEAATKGSGSQPVWADISPPFEFVVMKPNLAIVLLSVKHSDSMGSQLIGQAAFPVNRIRPGIRWVQLLDQKLMEIECSGVLMRVEMEPATKWLKELLLT